MVQIKQKDKRTGIVYVYEAEGGWDKEKKQTRYANRKLIGHIDPQTGEVVPNRPTKAKTDAPVSRRSFCGATMLLDQIAEQTQVLPALKTALSDIWQQVLSVAYYMAIEDRSPLSRYPRFADTHTAPYGRSISSQRSSELFSSITDTQRDAFCNALASAHGDNERLFYDTTSVSSYSSSLAQIKWGRNKDHVPLPQFNLAMLVGQNSGLPLYYRKVAGNIADVSTIKVLLRDMDDTFSGKIKFCMDRGFWSSENINAMMREHYKFLIGGKRSLKMFKQAVDEHASELHYWENYNEHEGLFGMRIAHTWNYSEVAKRTGEVTTADRRSYIYLYFSPETLAQDERDLAALLKQCSHELNEGNRIEKHEGYYDRYFMQERGKWVGKMDAINEANRYSGYFYLFSNEVMDPFEALELYSAKDAIEKCFGDVKGQLDFRTPRVSNDKSLNGKIFTMFVALILTTWLRRHMKESALSDDYTLHGLFDQIETIERFEQPGHRPRIGEVTVKQAEIFEKLGLEVPATS